MARTMKDSGVEWIGTIPKHWEIEQLGKLYKARSEKVSDYDYPPLSVTKMGIVPQLENAAKSDNHNDRKKVCIGDFVINSRSDRKMSSGSSNFEGSVSLINTVLYSNCILPEFSNYLLKNSNFAEEFYRWGTGIVADLWSTNYERMKRIPIPYVPLSEQRKIAAILDEKTTHIDSIVSKTKESIEAFKAYKQALITQAVTKGLNSDVKMKDSGIEWIGEIPEHWDISKIGKIFDVILGKMLSTEKKGEDWTFERYICAANVHFDGVDTATLKSMWFSQKDKENLEVKFGDLLIVEGGAGAGGSSLYLSEERNIFIQNSINIVRSKNERGNTKYAYYLMYSLVNNGYINFISSKATFAHFTKEKVQAVPFPIMPNKEQQQIADYLDEKCDHIDSLIANKEKMVQELEAYKKAMIYEYVTGKKEVE